jgi:hypothetical protein
MMKLKEVIMKYSITDFILLTVSIFLTVFLFFIILAFIFSYNAIPF